MIRSLAGLFVVASSLSLPLAAQVRPDLVVQSVSVSSTLPLSDGQRLVGVSFRIRNTGSAIAASSTTRVTIGGIATNLATPQLRPAELAFVSHSLRTTQPSAAITIQLDTLGGVPEVNEQNNSFQTTVQLARVEENRWLSIGPSTHAPGAPELGVGRVTTLAIDPRSPTIVYAGARGSGLWKTRDAGKTWFPVSDALPLARVDAVAIDPRSPERVLMASPAGVFESFNGGAVWIQRTADDLQPAGHDGAALLVSRISPSTLYLSSATGVLVSQDGGRKWRNVLGGQNPNTSLQLDNRPNTGLLFASLSTSLANPQGLGIFVGENGGLRPEDWHKLQGCPEGPLPAIPQSSRVWFAQSGAQQWMSFLAGGADGQTRALFKTTGKVCQVNGRQENVWRQVPIDPDCDKQPKDNSSFLFLHPGNSNLVFKGGRVLCRSAQGGTPVRADSGVHVDQHAIAVAPSNPAVLFLGNDGGIYRSGDSGASWTFVGDGLAVTEFYDAAVAVGVTKLLAGTQDNGGFTGTGGAAVWTQVGGGDVSAVAFDRKNPNVMFEVAGGIQRDLVRFEGTTAKNLSDPAVLPGGQNFREDPDVLGQLASTGGSPPLVAAFNGLWLGPPWRQINAAAGNSFHRVRLAPGGVWLAGTTDGRVFGGANVESLQLLFQTPSAINALASFTPLTYYVATSSAGAGRVFRLKCLENLVCKGRDISPPPDFAGEILSLAVDPEALLAALRGNGVIRGAPDSAGNFTWAFYNNGLPGGVTATDLETGPTGLIYLATFGRGMYLAHSVPIPVQGSSDSARGRVTSFEEERADPERPPAFDNPLITSVTLDSKPGFVFSAVSLASASRTKLRSAFNNHTTVTIDFVLTSAASGRITRVR
jgi:CARDB protein